MTHEDTGRRFPPVFGSHTRKVGLGIEREEEEEEMIFRQKEKKEGRTPSSAAKKTSKKDCLNQKTQH